MSRVCPGPPNYLQRIDEYVRQPLGMDGGPATTALLAENGVQARAHDSETDDTLLCTRTQKGNTEGKDRVSSSARSRGRAATTGKVINRILRTEIRIGTSIRERNPHR
ncbi:hypothetical protein ABEF95_006714 [Exophiala dermatitidis]|uniref:Uncharacterized protein n=1 Tax=Exophiala dermatitidis (strain ATCC 34100 / CBS 525.76 / NIH/UT8656) TaxID=858893 RepID=H6BUN1_EXODN|nr:uncharacterized protein HMPREF1120_03065 [Exophiala dermatitidis NIH/UT8656]EHY54906.1 hypothetical protein HMPREF1120_03065 [Exophiala dermatitidis NIH/UT8656]